MTKKDDMSIQVIIKDTFAITPTKKPFSVPTRALADAIDEEWKPGKKFAPSAMPLTALAYTGIDRIAGQEAAIIEALMVYVDTDTLSYRSSSEDLMKRQKEDWVPVLNWASKTFGSLWQTVDGIEPAVQTPEMHAALQAYFESLSVMQLAALCVLASSYSSIVLAAAVLKKHLSAGDAYMLSRLEEEVQAARWGRDFEADQKTGRVKAEIEAAGRFLRLLEQ
jgi:chaperone required for assembly of F1-ATPase